MIVIDKRKCKDTVNSKLFTLRNIMRKIFLATLTSIGLLQCATPGYTVWDHNDGQAKNLESVVQDALYKVGGYAYQNKLSSNKRNRATTETISRILDYCPRNNGIFSLQCVIGQVHTTLCNLAEENAKELCQGMTEAKKRKTIEQFRKNLNTRIAQNKSHQHKLGLPLGFFGQYLGNDAIYDIHRAQKQIEEQENNRNNNRLFSFIEWLLREQEEHHPVPQPDYSQEPSVPSYESPAKKLYPSEDCPVCFDEFGKYNDEGTFVNRVFLPCGHAHCYNCSKQMFFDNNNPEPCTQCRNRPKRDDVSALNRAATNAAYCCVCGKHESTMTKIQSCAHKLCSSCTKGWKQTGTEFHYSCPKCSSSFPW
jgi:hypothetical protein